MQVEYRGVRSNAVTLAVAATAPGLFTANSSGKGQGAILNQDGTVNTAANPAAAGSIVQIFLTGLPPNGAPVTVKIHDYTVTPVYAAAAPGFIGLQQVNAEVPPTLQSITSDLAICQGSTCSPNRPITIRNP